MSGGHFQSVPYMQSKLRTLADEVESDAVTLELVGSERRREFATFFRHVAEMVELLDKHAAGDMGEDRFSEQMTTLITSILFFSRERLDLAQRNADYFLRKRKHGGRQWDDVEKAP